jgi:hypothetical protein
VVFSSDDVTPVRRDLSRIDFWRLECAAAGHDFRAFAKTFLRQDQQTMIQQAEGLEHNRG